MGPGMVSFLEIWEALMWFVAAISILGGIGIYIYHKIRLSALKDNKARYDYVSRFEVKSLTYGIGGLAIALAAFINTTYTGTVQLDLIWFFVRLFIGFCFGTLIYYISTLIIKYTYPAKLNKKLRKYRYAPRISSSGNTMKLLSEDEEDVHLEEGMQVEEDVFSVDYDVWVDQKTNEVKIEKYPGHLQALKCNSCGFQTMKVIREEIISHPTAEVKGQLVKHYQCSYCKARRKTTFKIAQIRESDQFQLPHELHFREDKKDKNIDYIKIEIRTVEGASKSYEFQNLEEARQFLAETQDEKLLGLK